MIAPAVGLSVWARRHLRISARYYVTIVALVAVGLFVSGLTGIAGKAFTADGRFTYGSASHVFGPLPRDASRTLQQAAGSASGRSGVVCTSTVPISGLAAPVQARSIDFEDAIASSSVLTKVKHLAPGEALVSPSLRDLLKTGSGDPTYLTASGLNLRIVGTVENPDDRSARLLTVPLGTFPNETLSCDLAFSKVNAHIQDLLQTTALPGVTERPGIVRDRASESGSSAFAPIIFALQLLMLVLVGVLASTGFAASMETTQRELAVLLSVGASPRKLRRALLAIVALLAVMAIGLGNALIALFGGGISNAVSNALNKAPLMQPVDWSGVVLSSVVAVCLFLIVGFRPARKLLERSTVALMRERKVGFRASRRTSVSAGLGAVLFVGSLLLIAKFRYQENDLGTAAAVVVGLSPLLAASAVVGSARSAVTQDVTLQLAARDLARHRRRSVPSIVLGAVGLGAAMACVVTTSALLSADDEWPPVLSNQMIFTGRAGWFNEATDPLDPTASVSDDFVTRLTSADSILAAVQLQRVLNKGSGEPSAQDDASVQFSRTKGSDGIFVADTSPIYVATPELQKALGVDLPTDATDGIEVYTGRASSKRLPELHLYSDRLTQTTPPYEVRKINSLKTTVAPAVLISQRDAEHWGRVVNVGLLATSDRPFDVRDVDAIRKVADRSGVLAELPADPHRYDGLKRWAVIVACLFGVAAVGTATRFLAMASRDDSNSLLALGVGPRGLQRIDRYRTAVAALTCLVLAMPIAYLPVLAGQTSLHAPSLKLPISLIVVGGVVMILPLGLVRRRFRTWRKT